MAANNRLKFNPHNFYQIKLERARHKIISFLKRIRPVAGAVFVGQEAYLSFFDKNGLLVNKKISLVGVGLEGIKEGIWKIKKYSERNFDSLIVSLPAGESFLSVFEFPLVASDAQIEEAMKLSSAALPIAEKDVYADWMPLISKTKGKKEMVLIAGNKGIVNSYLKTFEENKLAVIAVETHALSIGRFLNDGDEITMVIIGNTDNFLFIIYDGQMPYFQFNLPKRINNDQNIILNLAFKTARRLIHFVRTDSNGKKEVNSIIILNDDEFKNRLEKEISGIAVSAQFPLQERDCDFGFLASIGAVKRGIIPRSKDVVISLMAIGTELAYERQRLFSLIDFFQKFLIGFGGFLIILLSGVFLMVNSLSANIDKLIQGEQNFPDELVAVKEKAIAVNDKIAKISGIDAITPNWENIFLEVDNLSSIGMPISSINGVNINSKGEFSLSGTAATREILVTLKNYFVNSSVFEAGALPLSLFLSDRNIDFSIKANTKNQKFLYKK